MAHIAFTVPGEVRGKGRPRFAKRGNFVKAYTDDKTASYENLVKIASSVAMAGAAPIESAVSVVLLINVMPPSSWSKTKRAAALAGHVLPTSKPDVDNVLKAIADACNGIVWKDDKQMADVVIRKRYSEAPGAHVTVGWDASPCA